MAVFAVGEVSKDTSKKVLPWRRFLLFAGQSCFRNTDLVILVYSRWTMSLWCTDSVSGVATLSQAFVLQYYSGTDILGKQAYLMHQQRSSM